jgi:uncharacterized protein YkwD
MAARGIEMFSRSPQFFLRAPFRPSLLVLIVAVAAVSAFASTQSVSATPVIDVTADVEGAAIGLINQEREAARLGGLSVAPGLRDVAALRAQEMAATDQLSHFNESGIGAESLLDQHGVPRSITGENIGRTSDPTSYSAMDVVSMLHDAFMHSQKHRDNVLDGRFAQIGVGMANANGKYYIAVVFTD